MKEISCLKIDLAAINNKLCSDISNYAVIYAKYIENEMKGVMSWFKKLDQKIDQFTGITKIIIKMTTF